MAKVTMPEPVAYLNPRGGVLTRLDTGLERETFTIKLLTTTQAEAYKDACVAEALEGAAMVCDAKAEKHGEQAELESESEERAILMSEAWKFRVCANDIRNLIPHNDNEQRNY